jgi:hypothetical protein
MWTVFSALIELPRCPCAAPLERRPGGTQGGLRRQRHANQATTSRPSTAAAVYGRSRSPGPIPQHHRARRGHPPTGVWFAPSRTVPRPPAKGARRGGGAPSPRRHRRSPERRLLSRDEASKRPSSGTVPSLAPDAPTRTGSCETRWPGWPGSCATSGSGGATRSCCTCRWFRRP